MYLIQKRENEIRLLFNERFYSPESVINVAADFSDLFLNKIEHTKIIADRSYNSRYIKLKLIPKKKLDEQKIKEFCMRVFLQNV